MIQLKPFKHLKLLLLIAFTVALSHFDALAYDFEVDGIYYERINDNEVSVTYNAWYSYSYSGDVVIPETVSYGGKTYSVTSIGKQAFSDCSGLTSVTIPNSVTSIGWGAFGECSSLTSVTIPNSVTTIDGFAFGICSSLTSFNGKFASEDHRCLIVDGVLNSFAPAGLTEYSIPNSVTSIGDGAFQECYELTSVTIPNSVTSIGRAAFSYCESLTSVTIPNSVTSIGRLAFEGCKNMIEVAIGNSVYEIGDEAFRYCDSLTEITIPNSVTSIGDKAFLECYELTSVTIPNSVTSIGDGTFSGCSSLTEVTIPNSVTSIGEAAFYDCTRLTSVTIPNSVTEIGERAFSDCSNLTSITVENPDPENINLGSNVFEYVPTSTCILYVPRGSKELYQAAPQWSDFENIKELEGLSVERVEMNAIQSITVVDGGLLINVEKESVITVADIAGRVRLYNVYPGENRINLESGIYVVNNNKIMFK